MIKDIIIIDDVLPKTYADEIEATLFSQAFPWFYADDITYGSATEVAEKTNGFSHVLNSDGRGSQFSSFIEPLYHIALDKANIVLSNPMVLQSRCFMQMPQVTKRLHNNKHIDATVPHLVVLYYVTDSDGDTFMFDGVDVIKTVTPKKNRVVIFNGSTYHASGTPAVSKRCIINFNIVGGYNGN